MPNWTTRCERRAITLRHLLTNTSGHGMAIGRVGPPPFDVSHGELVSTGHDFYRFARMLADEGQVEGKPMISADHLSQMTTDQVPAECKTPESFFPGAWDEMGWGFGLGITTGGPKRGRFGGQVDRVRTSSSIAMGWSASL